MNTIDTHCHCLIQSHLEHLRQKEKEKILLQIKYRLHTKGEVAQRYSNRASAAGTRLLIHCMVLHNISVVIL